MKRSEQYFSLKSGKGFKVVREWKPVHVERVNEWYCELDRTMNHSYRAERAVGRFYESKGEKVHYMNFLNGVPLEVRLPYDLSVSGRKIDVKTCHPGGEFFLSSNELRLQRSQNAAVVLCLAGVSGNVRGFARIVTVVIDRSP